VKNCTKRVYRGRLGPASGPASREEGTGVAQRSGSTPNGRKIPGAAVARLPLYYRALLEVAEEEVDTVPSERLAVMAGVNAAQVRKDLSYLGSYGTRGVGYDVEYLVYQISRALGLTQSYRVAIIGVGNLGHALANYAGFATRGFQIAALIDADVARVGVRIAGIEIRHLEDLEVVVKEHEISIGVIATPAAAAQDVCDRLVACGVTSVLNFAPAVLAVPDSVDVRKVDLSIELQILAFHEQRKAAGIDAAPGAAVPDDVRAAGAAR
jgi:redox-sensing transcriptional repressor